MKCLTVVQCCDILKTAQVLLTISQFTKKHKEMRQLGKIPILFPDFYIPNSEFAGIQDNIELLNVQELVSNPMNSICSSIKFRAAATLTYTASSSTQPSDHAEIPFSAYRLSSGRLIGQTSGAPPYIYFFNHKSINVQQQKKLDCSKLNSLDMRFGFHPHK